MPGSGGLKAIERIRHAAPLTRVLVLTMHDVPAYLRASLAAGASGYVVKRSADSDLLAAIREVHRGHTVLDPSLEDRAAHGSLRRRGGVGSTTPTALLSQREREVLELVAQGFTNQQIADRLGLSVKTVETYHLPGAARRQARAPEPCRARAVRAGQRGPRRRRQPGS
jgi:DNA-binding NarL/FixJ family response regulator